MITPSTQQLIKAFRFAEVLKSTVEKKNRSVDKRMLANNPINQPLPKSLKVSISPNPSTGLINIKISGVQKPVHFRIITADGQLFWQTSFQHFEGKRTFQYDLSSEKGTFYVQIIQGEEMVTKSIILL